MIISFLEMYFLISLSLNDAYTLFSHTALGSYTSLKE